MAELRAETERAGTRLATMSFESEIRFANAESRRQFAEDLQAAVEALIRKHHNDKAPSGRKFRLYLGIHPVVEKRIEEGSNS